MGQLIQWDEKNPQTVNLCCMDPFNHLPNCDGNCEKRFMTELEVMVWNEIEFCNRENMVMQGILPFMGNSVPGLPIDILDMNFKLVALIKLLVDTGVVDWDQLQDFWAREKINTFSEARKQKKRAEIALGRQQRKIIGLDGNPLN